jgi:hypothetical protein
LNFLPPEQFERGNIPANINSVEAGMARAVWQAGKLSRQKRGESAGFMSPGNAPNSADPNPLK